MSADESIWKGVRDLILLTARVDELTVLQRELTTEVRDVNRRLHEVDIRTVRLETLVEVARSSSQGRPRRLRDE